MARRKPEPRRVIARSSSDDKRRLRDPVPPESWLLDLASRASFAGHPKHKWDPLAFGLPLFSGERPDATYCDHHARFTPADQARIPDLLRRGILAGLIGSIDTHGDPTLLWTVDDTGWIYEGRITIPGRALYHAYPVLPREAIARAVIARYLPYAYEPQAKNLVPSAQFLQDRYS
ncbi:hypothetical protein [Rhodospirillum rubrum]|uniref:Uncharacterized protein n=1 Tax=Rhodospirillum rubrum (strain ATCC 11170 / ATH 1.1.1 / DSM 467 / LMG 4362 / NCIMB 8255 / S1) TaxID=269796 RepID=Q2RXV6_RHORT|nr:hypothetical protein [Rhodospirillum rubrum]ABC21039.1 hypothetical protein Rru_A0234 [Rhodospirillum rubrum ATCC 11170]AEO46706.1 hypothetical protein F11_01180 [Rhodospirillum rubrum F11]MBK5952583.1 hypothetical protein [Rhodospirillum rubrum]QXG80736.1 hypothetical protein KUL73_01240 [Rhodospirillum rubrum]HAQ00859.1 hypothetical protein [Rhodospirillum rubrum]